MKVGDWDSKEKEQMVGCMRLTCNASAATSFETQIPTILASTGKSAHSGMSTSLKTFKDFKRAGRDTGDQGWVQVGL
jgi:hypothetical protein